MPRRSHPNQFTDQVQTKGNGSTNARRVTSSNSNGTKPNPSYWKFKSPHNVYKVYRKDWLWRARKYLYVGI
jgi:hypothetical protein